MQPRERNLALAAGALLLLVGGQWGFNRLKAPWTERQTKLETAQKQAADKRGQVLRAELDAQQVKRWEEQALPWEGNEAVKLYRDGLASLVGGARLEEVLLSPERPVTVSRPTLDNRTTAVARVLTFTMQAEAELPQFVKFLHDFYSLNVLHRVKTLTLQPLKGSRRLKVTLVVEAVSLPNGSAEPLASRGRGDRLALADVRDYEKMLSGRNLFAPYTPPIPPRPVAKAPEPRREAPPPPPKPSFDDAQYAFVTAILDESGEPEVWVLVRTTGKLHKLRLGDSIEIGRFKGTLDHVGRLDVEILSEGKRYLVTLGSSLRDAVAVPDVGI